MSTTENPNLGVGLAAPAPKKVVNIRFKKLVEEAVIPTKGTEFSAGFDLVATSYDYCQVGDHHKYGFGISVEIPQGYTGFIFPRSSVKDTNLCLTNCVGVIDSDYRGEIKAVFGRLGMNFATPYNVGDRVCQLVIMRTPEVTFTEAEELSETERGEGGYGSTGR